MYDGSIQHILTDEIKMEGFRGISLISSIQSRKEWHPPRTIAVIARRRRQIEKRMQGVMDDYKQDRKWREAGGRKWVMTLYWG